MNSKETLLKLCHIATQQCKLHNVDVDFERDLVLRYMIGSWSFAITNKDSNLYSIYASNDHFLSFTIKVPWHREACDKANWKLHVFNSEVQMNDKAYDVILNAMFNGCQVMLDAKNKDEIENKIQHVEKDFSTKAKALLALKLKPSDPNFIAQANALSANFKQLTHELRNRAHPTIVFVPTGFKSIEELKIWCDLHDDA